MNHAPMLRSQDACIRLKVDRTGKCAESLDARTLFEPGLLKLGRTIAQESSEVRILRICNSLSNIEFPPKSFSSSGSLV